MPHTIEISDRAFRRLQAIARPLIDTTDTVINRLLDHYEQTAKPSTKSQSLQPPAASGHCDAFHVNDPPDLTHTRLIKANFGSTELARPKWNELTRTAHETAYKRVGSFDGVRQLTLGNIVKGRKNDEGFKPMIGCGFSIQGVDANDAWKISYGLAKKLGLPIEVTFEWREKSGAAHPGKTATLRWQPTNSESTKVNNPVTWS